VISRNTYALVTATMLLMSVADSAQAEQKPDSGTDVMVADNKIIEVGKDHTVILIDQKGIETTTDPSMPTNMTMIDCVGMAEALPDKTCGFSEVRQIVDTTAVRASAQMQ
jgi:hypothetical protein